MISPEPARSAPRSGGGGSRGAERRSLSLAPGGTATRGARTAAALPAACRTALRPAPGAARRDSHCGDRCALPSCAPPRAGTARAALRGSAHAPIPPHARARCLRLRTGTARPRAARVPQPYLPCPAPHRPDALQAARGRAPSSLLLVARAPAGGFGGAEWRGAPSVSAARHSTPGLLSQQSGAAAALPALPAPLRAAPPSRLPPRPPRAWPLRGEPASAPPPGVERRAAGRGSALPSRAPRSAPQKLPPLGGAMAEAAGGRERPAGRAPPDATARAEEEQPEAAGRRRERRSGVLVVGAGERFPGGSLGPAAEPDASLLEAAKATPRRSSIIKVSKGGRGSGRCRSGRGPGALRRPGSCEVGARRGAVLRRAAEGAPGRTGRSRAAKYAVSQVNGGRVWRGARCGLHTRVWC